MATQSNQGYTLGRMSAYVYGAEDCHHQATACCREVSNSQTLLSIIRVGGAAYDKHPPPVWVMIG
jgi:hypothetical protein